MLCHDVNISQTLKRQTIVTVQPHTQWRTQEFFSGGGVQQIQLMTNDRENGDLGAVAT
jgi:hypothetical protein